MWKAEQAEKREGKSFLCEERESEQQLKEKEKERKKIASQAEIAGRAKQKRVEEEGVAIARPISFLHISVLYSISSGTATQCCTISNLPEPPKSFFSSASIPASVVRGSS